WLDGRGPGRGSGRGPERGSGRRPGERVGLADRIRSLGRENLRVRALLCIERDRVNSLRDDIK
ncbi:hypothetical protein Tco_0488977, partial [Tanacetum coccineum]